MGQNWPLYTAGLLAGWHPAWLSSPSGSGLEMAEAVAPPSAAGPATTLLAGGEFLICTPGATVRVLAPIPCVTRVPRGDLLSISLPSIAHPEIAAGGMEDEDKAADARLGGTQAVMRACDILLAVGEGPLSLAELIERTGIPKPTCHRIASALVQRGLLHNAGRSGYRLGPVLRELADRSHEQRVT